jgi:hypothetical protein
MQVSWIDADRLRELVAQIAPDETSAPISRQGSEIEAASEVIKVAEVVVGWMDLQAEPLPAPTLQEHVSVEVETQAPQEEVLDESDEEQRESELHNAAAALPLSRIRDKLRAIRQRATEAGILTRPSEPAPIAAETTAAVVEAVTPMAEPSANVVQAPNEAKMETADSPMEVPLQSPMFDIPQGSREDRLAAFAAWAKQVLQESGGHVLVMNDDGEVLWGGEAKAGLVLSTMMAWGSAMHANTLPASGMPAVIHRTLSSGHVLTVIPCETSAGIMHAAVVAPEGVPDGKASLLRGALCAAIS